MSVTSSDKKKTFKLHKVTLEGVDYLITENSKSYELLFEPKKGKEKESKEMAIKLLKYAAEAYAASYVYEKIVSLRKKYEI